MFINSINKLACNQLDVFGLQISDQFNSITIVLCVPKEATSKQNMSAKKCNCILVSVISIMSCRLQLQTRDVNKCVLSNK